MTVLPIGDLSLDDPLLSTNKVAEMFDVKPETIRDWISQGKIAGVKVNRNWKVRRSVAVAFGQQRYGDPEADTQPVTPDDAPEAASGAAGPLAAGPCGDPGCPVLHDDPMNPVHPRSTGNGHVPCTDTDHPHPGGTCGGDA